MIDYPAERYLMIVRYMFAWQIMEVGSGRMLTDRDDNVLKFDEHADAAAYLEGRI